MASLGIDLSGILVQLDGLEPAPAQRLRAEWARFVVEPPAARAQIAIRVDRSDEIAPDGPFLPKRIRSRLDSRRALYEMPEGRAVIAADGRGRIELHREQGSREYFTLQNLLRACLAWALLRRGAGLVHAAGLVVDGRAFLLIGPEGSGKSTWAALGAEAGARVLSDDLVLIDGSATPPQALGAPFCSTYRVEYAPGRWPLAALLYPEHGRPPAWWPAPKLLSRARIAANLPFVADALEHDQHLAALIDRLCEAVPALQFRFDREPSFLDVLRREALPGS